MDTAVLTSWIIKASLVTSGGFRALPYDFAADIAEVAVREPFYAGDDGPLRTAAVLTALAWLEGSNQPAIRGDGGASYCALQVYLPKDTRTAQGWKGADLLADPMKCVVAGHYIAMQSVKSCATRKGHVLGDDLTAYARGVCDHPEGLRLSQHRMGLARRLAATVPVPAPARCWMIFDMEMCSEEE